MEVVILASALSFLIGALTGATWAFGFVLKSIRVQTLPKTNFEDRVRPEDLRPRHDHE